MIRKALLTEVYAGPYHFITLLTGSIQQRFRELKERKFIKKDYLQNIFASAQSCEQQFQNVRPGFFFVLLDNIYIMLCK